MSKLPWKYPKALSPTLKERQSGAGRREKATSIFIWGYEKKFLWESKREKHLKKKKTYAIATILEGMKVG